MPPITYTSGAAQGGGVDPVLAKGRYSFCVVDAEEKKSKAGNQMIEFKARHLRDDGTTGRAVYGNLVFTEKALWKVDQFVAACGKHPGEGEEMTLDVEEMIDWRFEAEVDVTQDDKGRDRNEFIDFIIPSEDGDSDATMNEPDIAELVECAKRESGLRERVYPKWIESGRMNPRKADREIECMKHIVSRLEKIRDEETGQASLF